MILDPKRNFVRITVMAVMLTMIAFTLLLGGYILLLDRHALEQETTRLREEGVAFQRDLLKREVTRLLDTIEFSQGHRHPDTAELKRDIAAWIQELTAGAAGYFFIIAEDGSVLAGPDRGLNLLAAGDTGEELFLSLKQAAETGDGFIEYRMHRGDWERRAAKLSYVRMVPGWRWIVGAGTFLDEIDREVAVKQAHFRSMITMHLVAFFTVMLIIVLSLHIAFVFLSKGAARTLTAFLSFFDRAATENIRIEPDRFYFQEMRTLAGAMNRMVEGRIRSGQQTHAERERLAVTLKSIGDGVITTDIDGRITLLNAAAEQITGWRDAEATGLPIGAVFRIVQEQTRQPAEDPVGKVLKHGRVESIEHSAILLTRDGREVIIEDSAAPIRNEAGEMIGVVLVFRDSTLKKNLEEQTRRMQRLESLGLLAGGIAHDFNNYLAGTLGSISVARMLLPDDHKAQEMLQLAERSSRRAQHLTTQLLTFSKGGHPVRRTTDLLAVLQESVGFSSAGSSVKVTVHTDGDIVPVWADEGQILQLFNNLLLNAVQAMPSGGAVTVRVGRATVDRSAGIPCPPGDYVTVAISDTGKGIAPEHLHHIFDPYFTTKTSGSGLGLTVAHSIATRHDGCITVSSQTGQGSTFTIYLPVSPEKRPPTTTPEAKPRSGGGRILIMDDEEVIREMLSSALRFLGYEPVTVTTGEEAIARYRKEEQQRTPFAALILDLTIPGGKGGEETLKAIRATDPTARAIAMSGYADSPILDRPLAYGFRAAVTKPFTVDDIGRALEKVLTASPSDTSSNAPA
ncbi:MAG TPA: ATP-binding protein [bacterium]|nr:ATP-binding protein [bacterium]